MDATGEVFSSASPPLPTAGGSPCWRGSKQVKQGCIGDKNWGSSFSASFVETCCIGCSLQLASCGASVSHGDLKCTYLAHTSVGSASRLPYAGLCMGSNAESSAPAAELSRNRCLACGKPRHEVVLGHGSFANSMNGPRNFAGVTLSLDSALLLVERQHRISLDSGIGISTLSVCLFQRCFLLHLTSCVLLCTDYGRMYPITHSVCHAVLQGAVPPRWTGSDTGEQPGRPACFNQYQSCPSGAQWLSYADTFL